MVATVSMPGIPRCATWLARPPWLKIRVRSAWPCLSMICIMHAVDSVRASRGPQTEPPGAQSGLTGSGR
eukprot:366029-Chlamydomonas_euryale.AAC.28